MHTLRIIFVRMTQFQYCPSFRTNGMVTKFAQESFLFFHFYFVRVVIISAQLERINPYTLELFSLVWLLSRYAGQIV